MQSNVHLRKLQEIIAKFGVLGTAACLVFGISIKLNSIQHPIEDRLYGPSFLNMPAGEETQTVWSEIMWAQTLLDDGRARADRDILRGQLKHYLYGLTSLKEIAQETAILASYNIELRLAGCEIGTPKHYQDMRYNDRIQSRVPVDAANIIGKHDKISDGR